MKATKRLIDSVWTVEYTLNENGTATIHNYSRHDPEGYERERQLPKGWLKEDDDRTVTALFLKESKDTEAIEYPVTNQKHIFDYNA